MSRLRIIAYILLLDLIISVVFTCTLGIAGSSSITRDHDSDVLESTQHHETFLNNKSDSLSRDFVNRSVSESLVNTNRLPASLRIIENEAFEGTAIVVVEIPENVESIGEKAFANIRSLRMVKIPVKTERIARNAFVGSDKVTITAAPGSYARTFARENGLPFAPIAAMTANTGVTQAAAASQVRRENIDIDTTGLDNNGENKPRWRPVDEIKTEQYDQCIAHCIIGRAPPACM